MLQTLKRDDFWTVIFPLNKAYSYVYTKQPVISPTGLTFFPAELPRAQTSSHKQHYTNREHANNLDAHVTRDLQLCIWTALHNQISLSGNCWCPEVPHLQPTSDQPIEIGKLCLQLQTRMVFCLVFRVWLCQKKKKKHFFGTNPWKGGSMEPSEPHLDPLLLDPWWWTLGAMVISDPIVGPAIFKWCLIHLQSSVKLITEVHWGRPSLVKHCIRVSLSQLHTRSEHKIILEVVAWYPTSSKVPLCQYMIYMALTTMPVCYVYWYWRSCNKLVITFVCGLYVITSVLTLRPAAPRRDAILDIALALM